jgi:hypothetical protein
VGLDWRYVLDFKDIKVCATGVDRILCYRVCRLQPFHLVDNESSLGFECTYSLDVIGLGIGLPPVIKFGSKYLRERVVADCLNGTKTICLAITGI